MLSGLTQPFYLFAHDYANFSGLYGDILSLLHLAVTGVPQIELKDRSGDLKKIRAVELGMWIWEKKTFPSN